MSIPKYACTACGKVWNINFMNQLQIHPMARFPIYLYPYVSRVINAHREKQYPYFSKCVSNECSDAYQELTRCLLSMLYKLNTRNSGLAQALGTWYSSV